MGRERLELVPITLVANLAAVKKVKVASDVFGIRIALEKRKAELSLQRWWSLVELDVTLVDEDDAFAQPVRPVQFRECIKLYSAPLAGQPVRRKDDDQKRRLPQRFFDFRCELFPERNAFCVSPYAWTMRRRSLNS